MRMGCCNMGMSCCSVNQGVNPLFRSAAAEDRATTCCLIEAVEDRRREVSVGAVGPKRSSSHWAEFEPSAGLDVAMAKVKATGRAQRLSSGPPHRLPTRACLVA
ncbi:hypothetical protein NY78_0377 [Desulfovibrio sp. TomC]|nr:hypothetical protein NY78_0377 [Desulfovibrio sp. TomC]